MGWPTPRGYSKQVGSLKHSFYSNTRFKKHTESPFQIDVKGTAVVESKL